MNLTTAAKLCAKVAGRDGTVAIRPDGMEAAGPSLRVMVDIATGVECSVEGAKLAQAVATVGSSASLSRAGAKLVVKGEGREVRVPVLQEAEPVPGLSAPMAQAQAIDVGELRELCSLRAFVAQEEKWGLTGVSHQGGGVWGATNGHFLAVVHIGHEAMREHSLLSPEWLELVSMLDGESATIDLTSEWAWARMGTVRVGGLMRGGVAPDMSAVWPTSEAPVMYVDAGEMVREVIKIERITRGVDPCVLTAKDVRLTLSRTETSGSGIVASAAIPATLEGLVEVPVWGADPKYLREVFRWFSGDVAVYVRGPLSPVVICGRENDLAPMAEMAARGRVAILMPMRID